MVYIPSSRYGVQGFKVFEEYPNKEGAMEILKRVADQVKAICDKHCWIVGTLSELDPSCTYAVGLNSGHGRKILIKLRRSGSDLSLVHYEHALSIMLHELTHCHISEHSSAFYKLLDELKEECANLIAKGITGRPFGGVGQATGGGRPANDARRAAALAAEARRVHGERVGMADGYKLGGGIGSKLPTTAAERRRLLMSAAERRKEDNKTCIVTQDGERFEFSADPDKAEKLSAETVKETEGRSVWTCPRCNHKSSSGDASECEACKFSRPPGDRKRAASPTRTANTTEDSDNMRGDDVKLTAKRGPGSWTCTECTLINPVEATKCEACEHRPTPPSKKPFSFPAVFPATSGSTTTSNSQTGTAANFKALTDEMLRKQGKRVENSSDSPHTDHIHNHTNDNSIKSESRIERAYESSLQKDSDVCNVASGTGDLGDSSGTEEGWACSMCTYFNNCFMKECEMCGTNK